MILSIRTLTICSSSEWYYALDYREIKVHDIDRLMSSYASMQRGLLRYGRQSRI
jgi:hypothetical protein